MEREKEREGREEEGGKGETGIEKEMNEESRGKSKRRDGRGETAAVDVA